MYEAKRIDLANGETPLETNIKKLLDGGIEALIEPVGLLVCCGKNGRKK